MVCPCQKNLQTFEDSGQITETWSSSGETEICPLCFSLELLAIIGIVMLAFALFVFVVKK